MSWADFDVASTLERDLLSRALPLVDLVAGPSASTATIDTATNTAQVSVTISETLGPTPSGCIDLLRIRPLLVGAAWKVLDLLLEEALELAGEQPDQKKGGRWSIAEKCRHAGMLTGRPAQVSEQAWTAMMALYVSTEQLRHSLVHRTVHNDSAGGLVGYDDKGNALPTMAVPEQEAFGRAVLRAAELVLTDLDTSRAAGDLNAQLVALAGVHGSSAVTGLDVGRVALVRVILDPTATGRYKLDITALRLRQPFRSTRYIDLVLLMRDRPGAELRGRLEEAPEGEFEIDPHTPPAWLH
ncbi:MAG: hypothetical protein JWN87_3073 [Frankiales bacterium]|nr:hypothetical protein [Frankiales bacterium]